MHDRNNPELIGLFQIDDPIREPGTEMPAGRRIKLSERPGMHRNLCNEPFDLPKEPLTQLLINGGVVVDALAELGVSFRMKDDLQRER